MKKKNFLKKGSVSVGISSDSIANNFSTEIDTKIVLPPKESPWKAEEKLVSGFSKFEFYAELWAAVCSAYFSISWDSVANNFSTELDTKHIHMKYFLEIDDQKV